MNEDQPSLKVAISGPPRCRCTYWWLVDLGWPEYGIRHARTCPQHSPTAAPGTYPDFSDRLARFQ